MRYRHTNKTIKLAEEIKSLSKMLSDNAEEIERLGAVDCFRDFNNSRARFNRLRIEICKRSVELSKQLKKYDVL